MAFRVKDYFHSYTKVGDIDAHFNIVRDELDSNGTGYVAYQNEYGSYFIQRITTSATVKIYAYYASNKPVSFATDWGNRASLSYGEYYQLFLQSL